MFYQKKYVKTIKKIFIKNRGGEIKKKIAVFVLLIGMIFPLILVHAEENLKGIKLASKKSYLLEETNDKYRVKLKVPGQDGDNYHFLFLLL